jgi:ADP-ribosylation factor-binding protein GGA
MKLLERSLPHMFGKRRFLENLLSETRLNADVPLHAQQLLAYKIQSPLEKEAVRGLDLLEICVRSSGKLFHNEIGKYRFLNELIRVVSPKYLGPR